jgi:hypothetical protein
MKRLIPFLLVGLMVGACHETMTKPTSPNFAARGCEPGPPDDPGGGKPENPGPPSDVGCRPVTSDEVLASLAAVYADLATADDGLVWSYYNLSEISTDEMIVPTRGSDWFDNGRWLEMQRHTWRPDSPAGLVDIDLAWVTSFRGVARANVLLETLQNARVPKQDVIEAEARTLRAFYYYVLMDMFGGVPIVTTPEIEPRPRNTRAEVFQFIESELNAARADLPDTWRAADYGRMTKGAADAILASLYLNAGVLTSDAPSATAYNSCMSVQVEGQTACDAAIAAADRILNSGQYSLATDWRSNFEPDNFASPENILVAKHSAETDLGLNFASRALHYNQLAETPWNGFAALAETYTAFDADDRRREIFLEGPQVNLDTGEPAFERNGTPLIFTVDIIDATQAGEGEGTRINKWPPDPDRVPHNHGNDFAYFRLGEILLIKAEALNELNPGSGEALALLNTLRERVFEPDEPLAAIDRDVILQERLFELTGEAKRRLDLIRHGRFTQPWSFKQAGASHLVLMPIPQPQLDANPMLAQNPGY